MIYFYFLFLIICFGSFWKERYKYIHSTFFSVCIALPYSFRGINIGNDTKRYYTLFLSLKSNLFEINELILDVDPFYLLLMYMSENFNVYLFIVSFLTVYLLSISIKDGNFSWIGTFMFLLFMGFFNVATDQSRQILAISFLIFSNAHNGISKYLSWIASTLTHKSIILIELINYTYQKLKIDSTLKALVQLIIVFLVGYNLYVWELASKFSDILILYNDTYANDKYYNITGLNSNGLLIYRTAWLMIFLTLFKTVNDKYDKILILGISVLIISSGFMPLERIGLTFFFLGLFFSRKTKLRSLNSLLLLIFSSIYFFSITILDLEKNGSSPWNCFVC